MIDHQKFLILRPTNEKFSNYQLFFIQQIWVKRDQTKRVRLSYLLDMFFLVLSLTVFFIYRITKEINLSDFSGAIRKDTALNSCWSDERRKQLLSQQFASKYESFTRIWIRFVGELTITGAQVLDWGNNM